MRLWNYPSAILSFLIGKVGQTVLLPPRTELQGKRAEAGIVWQRCSKDVLAVISLGSLASLDHLFSVAQEETEKYLFWSHEQCSIKIQKCQLVVLTHTPSMLSLFKVNFSIRNSVQWENFFSLPAKSLPIFSVTGVFYYCYIISHWSIFPPEHVMSFIATGTNIFFRILSIKHATISYLQSCVGSGTTWRNGGIMTWGTEEGILLLTPKNWGYSPSLWISLVYIPCNYEDCNEHTDIFGKHFKEQINI